MPETEGVGQVERTLAKPTESSVAQGSHRGHTPIADHLDPVSLSTCNNRIHQLTWNIQVKDLRGCKRSDKLVLHNECGLSVVRFALSLLACYGPSG